MSKYRQAAKVDANQEQIVSELRALGFSVQAGHDDLLIGAHGKTYWVEVKDPAKTLKKDGTWKAGALKGNQLRLLRDWKGHYFVACTTDQILNNIKRQ